MWLETLLFRFVNNKISISACFLDKQLINKATWIKQAKGLSHKLNYFHLNSLFLLNNSWHGQSLPFESVNCESGIGRMYFLAEGSDDYILSFLCKGIWVKKDESIPLQRFIWVWHCHYSEISVFNHLINHIDWGINQLQMLGSICARISSWLLFKKRKKLKKWWR